MTKSREAQLTTVAAAALMTLFCNAASAASFDVQSFATGAAIGATSPDSVLYGDGSIWISYQNGAASTGGSGASTVVRYTTSGTILNTWSIAGNVDGLRVDPSGLVWALQNNDANSALTVINPVTNATTAYTYGTSYTGGGNSTTRGFDDAQFLNGKTFLSETNPALGTDPIVLQLTTDLTSPLEVSGILNSKFTGTNLATGKQASVTITDPDSLILTPGGSLALTGEADQTIVFIRNAATSHQTVSFISLLGTNGKTISGFPDDTIFPTATKGYFYIADTGANTVYRIGASGLAPDSVYIDVGDEFGSLNLSTGVVTPIFTGISPHGGEFLTVAEAVPEPAPLYSAITGLVLCGAAVFLSKRRSS
jgi:hypothetical protein